MSIDQNAQTAQARRDAFVALGAVYDAEAAADRRLDELEELEARHRPLTRAEDAERSALYAAMAARLDRDGPHMTAVRNLMDAYGGFPPLDVVEAAGSADRFFCRLGYVPAPAEGVSR